MALRFGSCRRGHIAVRPVQSGQKPGYKTEINIRRHINARPACRTGHRHLCLKLASAEKKEN